MSTRFRTAVASAAGSLAAALTIVALLAGMAWALRPDMSKPPPRRDPADVRAVAESREVKLDPANRPVVWRAVDYSEGPSASWYPRNEPPILAGLVKPADWSQEQFEQRLDDLVDQGELTREVADLAVKTPLPPVADRVGPEPLVLEGPDGIGRHGGTWYTTSGVTYLMYTASATTLVRWSPQGDPIVPHVAKSYSCSPDYRQYTFHLRKGMRWSDGRPFTADDILYWWVHEANDPYVRGSVPPILTIDGEPGEVTKIDAHTVRFSFPKPHGLFLPLIASARGIEIVGSPAHYLRPYHPNPEVGDHSPGGLIERTMAARNLGSPKNLYVHLKGSENPEHPRLWPWLYRTYRPNAPYDAVRNPYYWAVDTRGNQLPYVDHLHMIEMHQDMVVNAAASGRLTVWHAKMRGEFYTQILDSREKGDYHVYHWYMADRTYNCVSVNQTYRGDPKDPASRLKAALLADKRFRQALSLALNRREIIDADYYGLAAPTQASPGPGSYFHYPKACDSYIDYDPARANRMLDELGLTKRDYEGYRTFPDGSRMQFFLNSYTSYLPSTIQFITDSWKAVGVRVIPRIRDSRLFYAEKSSLLHEFNIFPSDNDYEPLMDPRSYVPTGHEANHAIGYANWYERGGLRRERARKAIERRPAAAAPDVDWIAKAAGALAGKTGPAERDAAIGALAGQMSLEQLEQALVQLELRRRRIAKAWQEGAEGPRFEALAGAVKPLEELAEKAHAILAARTDLPDSQRARLDSAAVLLPTLPPAAYEPAEGSDIRKVMELYDRIRLTGDRPKQRELMNAILDLAADNVWTISACAYPPMMVLVKNGFKNVPRTAVHTFDFICPGNTAQETCYFEQPSFQPGVAEMVQKSILKATPPPESLAAAAEQAQLARTPAWLKTLLKGLFAVIAVAAAALVAVKHPYVARRLLIMVPTLLIISLLAFIVIQLPAGDYVTYRIMELQARGDKMDKREITDLREMFYLDDPVPVRYARWLGLRWFGTLRFDAHWPFAHGDTKEEGLLQGNLGRSMADNRPVNQVVGDRILLTFLISLGTILFTWAIAIPVGIYSAVRQYSIGDYVFTFLGFLGMCVPSFLMALVLMHLADAYLGWDVSLLLSPRYSAQPHWDLPKVVDLLKHIWVPVVILGLTGTAGMIRVMRGNLLDELKKPYVVAARAKGVRPLKLLMKYPVRLALNPFISGIGGLFPQLLSGGAIVATVLSLPTIGPRMLQALLAEDMYLAGSLLMVFSALGVAGTLVSDLLLLWLDPRIRFKGGTR